MVFVVSDKGDLTAREFIDISRSVGWGLKRRYDLKKVKKALGQTTYVVTVRDNRELVGCGRAFSDDLLFTTIPDVFVKPEYQRKGIGTRIMQRIIKRFGHTTIYFGSQPGNELFFEKCGFVKGMQSYGMKRK